jgi:hypothetical protein
MPSVVDLDAVTVDFFLYGSGRSRVLEYCWCEGSVHIEVQRHREREEEWRNQAAIRIAGSLKLPVLATNGVRYATAYDREVLDVFTVVRHHTDLDHAGRLLSLNNRRHLRPGREMAALFRDVPGAVAEMLELSARLGFQLDDLGYEFPHYPVPDGETMDSFLRKRVAEGVLRRYGPKNDCALLERAKKQVDHELDLIARLGFAGYFLIVWDIVCFCKKKTSSAEEGEIAMSTSRKRDGLYRRENKIFALRFKADDEKWREKYTETTDRATALSFKSEFLKGLEQGSLPTEMSPWRLEQANAWWTEFRALRVSSSTLNSERYRMQHFVRILGNKRSRTL